MSAVPTTPEALAAEVLQAAARPWSSRTLLVDLDGTLAPIAPSPDEVVVPEGALRSLGRLARGGWRVAVVSGRALADVRRLVDVEGVLSFGSHGLEGSWGGREAPGPSLAVRQRLAAIGGPAKRLTWHVPGSRVEVKPAGIAFHDREVAEHDLERWRQLVDELLASSDLSGLERFEGRRVVELRPKGEHKGKILQRMPRRSSVAGHDASLVALGDDRTDEELFEVLGSRGLSVVVGDGSEPTHAVRRLGSPADVAEFLERVADGEEARLAAPASPRTR